MTAAPVPPTEMKLCKKKVQVVIGVLGPFLPPNTVDMLIGVLATIQSAKYGRSDKTSLVQYNPGWCVFGVLHVPLCMCMYHQAPPHFLHVLAWSMVPGSPSVSRYTQDESIKEQSSILKVKYHCNHFYA